MTHTIQTNLGAVDNVSSMEHDKNIEGILKNSNIQNINSDYQTGKPISEQIVHVDSDQYKGHLSDSLASPPTNPKSGDYKSTVQNLDPTDVPKKNTRNRKTYEERKSFTERCISLYKQRRSTKLIAYELGVREAEVKQVLFDFMQNNPGQIVEAKEFFATPEIRMKDICGKDTLIDCYEVVRHDDGTLVFKPLREASFDPTE